eukprot:CFRG0716T1
MIGTSLPLYTALSVGVTAVGISYALNKAEPWHDESSVVLYLLKAIISEKLCVLMLVNMTYVVLLWVAKLVQYVFFGELRPVESQQMYDRLLNYLMFKIMFVGAILEPDMKELVVWTTWFSILGFLRVFSMLARDRYEYVTASPTTPISVHGRLLLLLVAIQSLNMAWLGLCVYIFVDAGVSALLLLTFECVTLFLDTLQTIIKYSIHLYDLRHEGVWESRSSLIYHTEIITDLLVHIATLLHYMHVITLHGVSFTLIDAVLFLNVRTEFKQFRKRLRGYQNYLIANRILNTKYPDVKPEEIKAYDDQCAICRDEMMNAKKLPCGHMYHASCLRSWLEHHGSCPTCRLSLLDVATTPTNVSAGNVTNVNVDDAAPGIGTGVSVRHVHSPNVSNVSGHSYSDGGTSTIDRLDDISALSSTNVVLGSGSAGSSHRTGIFQRRGQRESEENVNWSSHGSNIAGNGTPSRDVGIDVGGRRASGSLPLPRLQDVSDAFSRLPPLTFSQTVTAQVHNNTHQRVAVDSAGSARRTDSVSSFSGTTNSSITQLAETGTQHNGRNTNIRNADGGASDGDGFMWSSWLTRLTAPARPLMSPSLSTDEINRMADAVLEIFPQANRRAVVADLYASGSVMQTTNNVLSWPVEDDTLEFPVSPQTQQQRVPYHIDSGDGTSEERHIAQSSTSNVTTAQQTVACDLSENSASTEIPEERRVDSPISSTGSRDTNNGVSSSCTQSANKRCIKHSNTNRREYPESCHSHRGVHERVLSKDKCGLMYPDSELAKHVYSAQTSSFDRLGNPSSYHSLYKLEKKNTVDRSRRRYCERMYTIEKKGDAAASKNSCCSTCSAQEPLKQTLTSSISTPISIADNQPSINQQVEPLSRERIREQAFLAAETRREQYTSHTD